MASNVIEDEIQPSETWPDKEFLEQSLRNWLKVPRITIRDFTSRIATNKGDNYTSDMFRVTIKYEQKEDPLTIIIKRIINIGSGGEVISKSTAFAREEMMISTVLPEIYSVLKQVLPDVEPLGAGYVYSVPGVLAMEDLRESGFRMADRRLGLDLKHCSLVLHTLARYHAASVHLLEQKTMDLSLFQKFFFAEKSVRPAAENMFNSMLKVLSVELKNMEGLEKYSAKLSKLAAENFVPYLQRAVEDHEERDFLVLSHGDLWINNMLFRYSSSGEPDGVRFVDLQLPCVTSPCIDLQCFLPASANETVRTTHTDQLIEQYHLTLCETMSALECFTRPPTLKKLKQDFEKKSHYGMLSAFLVLPVALAEPGEYDVDDVLNTGKPQGALFNNKAYKKALEWFLPLYERKGFL